MYGMLLIIVLVVGRRLVVVVNGNLVEAVDVGDFYISFIKFIVDNFIFVCLIIVFDFFFGLKFDGERRILFIVF